MRLQSQLLSKKRLDEHLDPPPLGAYTTALKELDESGIQASHPHLKPLQQRHFNLSHTFGIRTYFYDKPHNFAPRLAYAWAPGKSKNTVVRDGAGMFYDRTGPSPISDLLRFDGLHLLRYLIDNPQYPDPLIGGPASAAPASIVRLDPPARDPYSIQYCSRIERHISQATTLALN